MEREIKSSQQFAVRKGKKGTQFTLFPKYRKKPKQQQQKNYRVGGNALIHPLTMTTTHSLTRSPTRNRRMRQAKMSMVHSTRHFRRIQSLNSPTCTNKDARSFHFNLFPFPRYFSILFPFFFLSYVFELRFE